MEIKNVVKGAYRSYIRFPGVLFENDISTIRDEKILIQIDTVPHAFDYAKDLKILNKFDVFTQVYATPLAILLSQKIYAALNRPRAKGRDFYDIIFLLPQTKPDYRYLGAKAGINNGRELKERLVAKTSDLNFRELAGDIAPFLVKGEDSNKVKLFVDYIKSLEF